MRLVIVVDGRTDREKLVELLQQPEQTHLEFKAELDLTTKTDELNFVKDAVAISNRPTGGYLLVGVNNDGTLALPIGAIRDREMFDSARLGDKIRKYIDGEVHPVAQVHEVDGHEVVLIYLPHHRDGLPVPMSKLGQYQDATDKTIVAFRPGDVLVREGAKNIPLRHAHWTDLLSARDQRLRQQARADLDSLIAELAAAVRLRGAGPVSITLSSEMANDAFSDAVIAHLGSDSDVRLRQFLVRVSRLVASPEQRQTALDKITIVVAQAMYFERQNVADLGIRVLFDAYAGLGYGESAARLEIVTRLYVLGSLAVRLRQWARVHDLVIRPYPPSGDAYIYSSWIRHGQVDASRAKLFPEDKGGLMISAARVLMSDEPTTRPDVPDRAVPNPSEMARDDLLLNSLCQFDILYCLIVEAEGRHHGTGYPAASALNQNRADPAFEVVANDPEARAAMFPNSNERAIAEAMQQVFSRAERESFSFGGHWGALPPGARQFVGEHLEG